MQNILIQIVHQNVCYMQKFSMFLMCNCHNPVSLNRHQQGKILQLMVCTLLYQFNLNGCDI